MVIRTMYGAGIRAASQHSQALYPIFTHIPGLKVVVPSTPYDAKGLLIQAIRDDDPVIFLEHKVLYTLEGDVPEEPYAIPFGEANIVREGDDVTVVALGRMVQLAEQAARASSPTTASRARSSTRARRRRSTRTRSSRASRTPGRLVVVDEANPRCGLAADIVALRRAGGVRRPQGGAADGHAAAHAGAVQPGARGRLRARRRTTIADARPRDGRRRRRAGMSDASRSWACPSGACR